MEVEESPEDEEGSGTRGSRPSGGVRPANPQSAIRNPKLPWPKTLAEQVNAVSQALASAAQPLTAAEVAARFQRAQKDRKILETLVALGKARPAGKERYQP